MNWRTHMSIINTNLSGSKLDSILKPTVNVLLLLLIGILSFFGGQIYLQVNHHIPEQFEQYAKKADVELKFDHLNTDINYLAEKVDEINCFLRDNPIPKIGAKPFYNIKPSHGDKNVQN